MAAADCSCNGYDNFITTNPLFSMNDLSEDVIEYIFLHLSPYGDLQNCRLVCKQWKRLAEGAMDQLNKLLLRCNAFDWFLLQQHPGDVIAANGVMANNKSFRHTTITERCSHAACYHESTGCIYVFGGCTAAYTTFNDLWKFDLAQRTWIRPMPTGNYPTPKACATMVEHKGKLLLFGGWSKSSPNPIHQTAMFYNELHLYDPASNNWTAVPGDGSAPHLAGHSCSVVNCGQFMIIFGGSHGSGSSNRIWVYHIEQGRWFSPNTTSPRPAPRYGQSQILIDDRHILIVGGCGGPNLIISDVWLLTINGNGSDHAYPDEHEQWLWEEIVVLNPHLSAPQLWSHPACKVGSKVVVLSKSQQAGCNRGSYRSMSMSPRLGTSNGATTSTGRPSWVPPHGNLIPPRQKTLISSRSLDEQNGPSGSSSSAKSGDRLGAGNGDQSSNRSAELQRARSIPAIIVGEIPQLVVTDASAASSSGSAAGPTSGQPTTNDHQTTQVTNASPSVSSIPPVIRFASTSSSSSSTMTNGHHHNVGGGGIGGATPFGPQNSNNSNSSRIRFRPSSPPPKTKRHSESSLFTNHSVASAAKNPMSIYVLDTSNVLTAKTVAWSVLDENFLGGFGGCGDPASPEDTILYSLVKGRGELILFGGMRSGGSGDCHGLDVTPFSHTITNETYILKPPISF